MYDNVPVQSGPGALMEEGEEKLKIQLESPFHESTEYKVCVISQAYNSNLVPFIKSQAF